MVLAIEVVARSIGACDEIAQGTMFGARFIRPIQAVTLAGCAEDHGSELPYPVAVVIFLTEGFLHGTDAVHDVDDRKLVQTDPPHVDFFATGSSVKTPAAILADKRDGERKAVVAGVQCRMIRVGQFDIRQYFGICQKFGPDQLVADRIVGGQQILVLGSEDLECGRLIRRVKCGHDRSHGGVRRIEVGWFRKASACARKKDQSRAACKEFCHLNSSALRNWRVLGLHRHLRVRLRAVRRP